MKLKMFSVFDSKVAAYMNPFFARSTAEAIRMFSDAVGNPQQGFCKHPEDYTLFEVGSWDDQTAGIDLLQTPHSLAKAIQFVQLESPELNRALNRGVVEVVK